MFWKFEVSVAIFDNLKKNIFFVFLAIFSIFFLTILGLL